MRLLIIVELMIISTAACLAQKQEPKFEEYGVRLEPFEQFGDPSMVQGFGGTPFRGFTASFNLDPPEQNGKSQNNGFDGYGYPFVGPQGGMFSQNFPAQGFGSQFGSQFGRNGQPQLFPQFGGHPNGISDQMVFGGQQSFQPSLGRQQFGGMPFRGQFSGQFGQEEPSNEHNGEYSGFGGQEFGQISFSNQQGGPREGHNQENTLPFRPNFGMPLGQQNRQFGQMMPFGNQQIGMLGGMPQMQLGSQQDKDGDQNDQNRRIIKPKNQEIRQFVLPFMGQQAGQHNGMSQMPFWNQPRGQFGEMSQMPFINQQEMQNNKNQMQQGFQQGQPQEQGSPRQQGKIGILFFEHPNGNTPQMPSDSQWIEQNGRIPQNTNYQSYGPQIGYTDQMPSSGGQQNMKFDQMPFDIKQSETMVGSQENSEGSQNVQTQDVMPSFLGQINDQYGQYSTSQDPPMYVKEPKSPYEEVYADLLPQGF